MVRKPQILNVLPYVVLFLLSFHFSRAQFSDNFSDGDFSGNPAWSGSTADFTINASFQLQLNNTVAATSYLSSPFSTNSIDNFEWQVFVKQSFAPSGSNFGRVYLVSDQANLSGSLNGYFLQFGEAGSADAVQLFRQTGVSVTSVCRATDALIASSVNLRVRVLRNSAGLWQLFIDYSGGTNYQLEASGTDITHTVSSHAGVLCVYTVSNATRFYYDDFYMGPEIIDTESPSIVSVIPNSATELDVVFNENVDATSSQLTTSYSVNNGIGNPLTALLQGDQKTVRLTFSGSFPNGTTSQLTVTGVKDLLDNAIGSASSDFFFFQPVPAEGKDIIITEILADPSPVIGLPEAEFIELYNRSSKIFNLQNWKLTDGSSTGNLPAHYFYPGEYVVLAPTASAALFTSFGTTLGITNFPTLNNSGDALTLKDNSNVEIDFVHYLDTWYQDEDKKQGGYSLELIDPANPCAEEENWIAPEAIIGGTPGTQNSVFANKPDLTGPTLISAVPVSASRVVLKFNEKLSAALPDVSAFSITPAIPVSAVAFTDASLRSMLITLSTNLLPAVHYSITVQNIRDCNGNLVLPDFDSALFGLPEDAAENDVLINEILFNPRPTGIDFVEVYNNSSKFINLKNWSVANSENETPVNGRPITTEDILLGPGEYRVFCENNNLLKGEYIAAHEENFFQVTDLPSFNDDEGSVALVDNANNIIDYFLYSDDFHSVFIKDDEGVSLERISFEELTNTTSNWKSASSAAGYATPGFINSNSRGEASAGKLSVNPEIFEPLSGTPNFTQIQYNFEQGGFVANIKILDHQGREIKRIANNEVLGTTGFFRWDGDTYDGSKARTGYYVVWAEVFNSNGQVDVFRERVVVASGK